jgi:hypothetical protein
MNILNFYRRECYLNIFLLRKKNKIGIFLRAGAIAPKGKHVFHKSYVMRSLFLSCQWFQAFQVVMCSQRSVLNSMSVIHNKLINSICCNSL